MVPQRPTGDDAGYLYGSLYGFGISRELELQQEAGFSPLEVLKHATVNGAKVLGLDDRLGRVRTGFIADLLIVNGNPLENLRLMNPYGTDLMASLIVHSGIPYHVPTLMKEVKEMVAKARADRAR